MRFGVVVLAAGRSSRMGAPKLMLQWRGQTLLRRAIEAGLESGAAEVVVVLGHEAERLAAEVPVDRARIVRNPDFERGQSTSLRRGLAAMSPDVAGAVCYPADQPFVTASAIGRLVATHQRTGRSIVVSEATGIRGAPVFFARELFPSLMDIQGDQGAREFIKAHPQQVAVERFDGADLMLDVDTPEDYQRLLRREAGHGG